MSHTALRDQVLLEAGDVVVTNNASATSSLSQPASLSDFPTEACFIRLVLFASGEPEHYMTVATSLVWPAALAAHRSYISSSCSGISGFTRKTDVGGAHDFVGRCHCRPQRERQTTLGRPVFLGLVVFSAVLWQHGHALRVCSGIRAGTGENVITHNRDSHLCS